MVKRERERVPTFPHARERSIAYPCHILREMRLSTFQKYERGERELRFKKEGGPLLDFGLPLLRLRPHSHGACLLWFACAHACIHACTPCLLPPLVRDACVHTPHTFIYPCLKRLIPLWLCLGHPCLPNKSLVPCFFKLKLESHFIYVLSQTLLKKVLF